MENENEVKEVVEEEIEDLPEVGEDEVDLTDYKALALKNIGIAKRLKTKLSKQEVKEVTPEVKVEPKKVADLTPADLYTMFKANINEEDVPDVQEFASFKGITISEALKNNVVKNMLADKEEQRKVASATNTGTSKRGSSKVSDETLLDKASKGDLPESDEEITRLVKARQGL